MDAAPEKLLGIVEHVLPPPSVFLDHLQAPVDGLQPQDGLALDYISRMLMEDGTDNKFFCEYPDHPALLQAQQPFAEILSTSGCPTSSDPKGSMLTDMLACTLLPGDGKNTENHNQDVQNNGISAIEPNNSLPSTEGGTRIYLLSRMAFFQGMEEANSFLYRESAKAGCRGHKNMIHGDDETEPAVRRSIKKKAVSVQPDMEEDAMCEMLDNLILHGYDMSRSQVQEIRVAMEREREMQQRRIYRKSPRGSRRARQPLVVDLQTKLLRCAEAVANSDRHNTWQLLEEIKLHSSPTGDATQRLAHYFAEGLEARLAGKGSQLYRSIRTHSTCPADILKAFQLYTATSCFIKVAFHFANRTIYNAVSGKKKLHIVHYGMYHGFQWTELLQWLAGRVGGPPEVRITFINCMRPVFSPAERIEQAGHRLSQCANHFRVPFKFRAIAAKPEYVQAEDLDIEPNEVLVVNNIFHFKTLMDESLVANRISPRDRVLHTIRRMKPSVFVHAVVNGSYSPGLFVTRFREALYNLMAHFDAFEATVPRDNVKRLLMERHIFARFAVNIIACEGVDRVERPQNYKEWQARNQRAGLRQLPLDAHIVGMLKDMVKKQYHKHFMINEDNRWLLQGWKGRVLYALSTWTADDGSSSDSA